MPDDVKPPDTASIGKSLDEVAPDPAKGTPSRWAEPASRLRATTRWVLAVFGALGTAFLTSVPFAGLGKIEWPSVRGGLAFAAVVLVTAGLVLILRAASEVFISRVGTLTDLHSVLKNLGLRYAPLEIFGGVAKDADDLAVEWQRAYRERWSTAVAASGKEATSLEVGLAQVAKDRWEEVDSVSTAAVSLETYRELVAVFRWAQRWIFVGAVCAAIGAFVFFSAVQGTEEKPAAAASESTSKPLVIRATQDQSSCVIGKDQTGITVSVSPDSLCTLSEATVEKVEKSADAAGTKGEKSSSDECFACLHLTWKSVCAWLLALLPALIALAIALTLYRVQRKQQRSGQIIDTLFDPTEEEPNRETREPSQPLRRLV